MRVMLIKLRGGPLDGHEFEAGRICEILITGEDMTPTLYECDEEAHFENPSTTERTLTATTDEDDISYFCDEFVIPEQPDSRLGCDE